MVQKCECWEKVKRQWSCCIREGQMRRYLGADMNAYSAVMLLIFFLMPIFFAASALYSTVSEETIFLTILCVICSLSVGLFLFQNRKQLYCWGVFGDNSVIIYGILSKRQVLYYQHCKSVGIGWYVHGTMNSRAGSNVWYIFLSYEPIEEQYRSNINKWKPSATGVKVGFDERLYRHLVRGLPAQQQKMLQTDFKKFCNKIT